MFLLVVGVLFSSLVCSTDTGNQQEQYREDMQSIERTTSSLFMFYWCLETSGPVYVNITTGLNTDWAV